MLQKQQFSLALLLILLGEQTAADVSISGKVQFSLIDDDTNQNTSVVLNIFGSEDLGSGNSAFEYMDQATFATFDSFVGVTSSSDLSGSDPANLVSLYPTTPSPMMEWRNSSGETLMVVRTENTFTSGGSTTTTVTISLQDSAGTTYGGSNPETDPVVLHTSGTASILDQQNVSNKHILSTDFNNLSMTGYGANYYRWSPQEGEVSIDPINVSDAGTINRPEYSFGHNQGHPFIMKGVDSITGKTNGFLNIVPDLGSVARAFAKQKNGFGAIGALSGAGMENFTVHLNNTLSAENLSQESYLKIDNQIRLLGTIPTDNSNCATVTSTNCAIEGLSSVTSGLNSDSTVIIGSAYMIDRYSLSIGDLANTLYSQAFRWSENTGMTGLGSLTGGNNNSYANAVSGDGQVVIGTASSTNGLEAFRWSSSSGMVGLGDLSGGSFHSVATATNNDGAVIAGFSEWNSMEGRPLFEAFRWTEDTGMVGLGKISSNDEDSFAVSMNGSGTVIVGASGALRTNQLTPFRWSDTNGMQSIKEWLTSTGIKASSVLDNGIAYAVNEEGTMVVGSGTNGPWFARAGKGMISATEAVSTTLMTSASIPQVSSSLPTIALHGAHHQPLLAQKQLNTDRCAWINGDFANYQSNKADSQLVETGACVDLQSNTRLGVGIGKSRADQKLDYSGSSDINGKYLLVELDHQLAESPMLISATLLHGNWDADINRGYLNAGNEDLSKGSTSIQATAIRGRVDWRDLYTVNQTAITPKFEYTITNTDVDGYTETTGGFPARFDPQSHTSRESRIGIIAENRLNSTTTIRGIAEEVHRFDKNGASFSGEVIDMFPFSIPGAENRSDWLRVGAEIDHQLDKEMFLSGSLMRSSRGEDAEVSGAISLKIAL